MPDQFGGVEIEDEFGGVAVEEESTPPEERPPRGEMLEPPLRPSVGATGMWGAGATGTWEEESPEQRRIRTAVDLFAARKEGDAAEREAESLGEQYRSIERFTPAGILNQPERIARAIAAPDAPEIPERFQPGQPIFPIPEPQGTNTMAGLGQLGVQTLNALQTPEMIVTAPAAVNPVGRALFAADMGRHIPEQVEQGAQVIGDIESTPAQKVVAGGTPIIAGTMTALLGKSEIPRPVETIIAKTEAAVPGALSKAKAALADTAKREPISDQVQQLETAIEKGIPDEAIQVQEAQGPQDVLKDVAREKEIEAELSNLAARRGRFDATNPRMEALRTEMRALQAGREAAQPVAEQLVKGGNKITKETVPERVAVQAEQVMENGETVPGYVTIQSTGNAQSGPVEAWRAAGHEIPDTAGLPSGTYTVAELKARANEKATPAAEAPVEVGLQQEVGGGLPKSKTSSEKGGVPNAEKETAREIRGQSLTELQWQDSRHVLRRTLESSTDPGVRKFLQDELNKLGRSFSEYRQTEATTPTTADQAPIPARQAPVVEPRVGAVPENVSATSKIIRRSDYKTEREWADAVAETDRWASDPNQFSNRRSPSLYEPWTASVLQVVPLDRGFAVEYAGQRVGYGKTEAAAIKAAEATHEEFRGKPLQLSPATKSTATTVPRTGSPSLEEIGDRPGESISRAQPLPEPFDINAAGQVMGLRPDQIAQAKAEGITSELGLRRIEKNSRTPLPEPAGQIKAGEELPVPAASQALKTAESKLADVVNQTIEQSSPTRLGVSPAATMRPMDVVLGAPDLRSLSPAVEARWQQAVKGTDGIIDKVKTQAAEAWKSVTREYADLPPREFPAEIDVLRRQRASPNASARTAVDVLKGITNNLGPKQYGVFNRVALLEDLVKDVESGKYATGNDLPFGYKDAGELTADLNKFRAVAESTPQIRAALERRREFMDAMRGTLVERGFLPESVLSDPRYFHHQVLLYMAEKNAPAGSRSFRDWFSGWQKKRTGSSKDYNRQYVEAEAEVLADAFNKFTNQDLHGEMQGIADIASQLKEVHGAEWRQHIPKSYTTWQPKRGNIFYQVQTVAERVMDRYLSGLGDILPSEFKEALAVGGRRQEWVIPKPLAKVLDNIAPRPDNWIGRLATTAQNSWKRYILLNPLRAAKYNLNNLSGDLDFLFAAQPKIFKEFKASASDMWGFHVKGKSAAGDIKEAIQDGVISSGWRASELPDIARSDYFNWLTGEKPKLVDRYWNWIGKRTDAREDTGRLASYRFAKKEWEAGRPFYGASVPADVNALATPRLKAAKVAREILIDYGRGTEFSNFTRQKLVPFFKWMEGNFVRYQQLIRNIPEHEGAGPRVAGAAGKKAATLALRMGAAYGIINLWNHMFFPKEEEELGEGRNQLHLILGRDDQGNVQTIRFQGALSDLLGWVGGEDLPQDVKDLATGKASVGDKMEDAYEAGISRAVNASLPFPKTAAEIGLGRSFYPNALQPRPVRDKAEHAAGLFSLKPVYQWLAGKPHKPLRQEIANLISYTTDPGEAAYNTTRHMAGEWLEEHGEERANVIPGKRSNALYYYKQALRYKDQETAKKFLDEYNRLGGKREGLNQSIKASAPLSMLGTKRKAFLDSLSPQEQEAVRRAEEWYRRVYAQPPTPNPNP